MDYKKIFKSANTRQRILDALSFVPDVPMLKLQYFIKQGKRLNLRNPQLFTEKLQWYKVNYRDSLMVQCVDKYDVREYVRSVGFESILNECYGVFDSADDVDFDTLPNSFVIKDTIGGGGRSVIIVKNRDDMDCDAVMQQMREWIKLPHNKPALGREWPYYSGKKHRIIIEKYIDSNPNDGGLIDYKFFCFNGEPKYLYVIADRAVGRNAGLGIYNERYERLPYQRVDERPLEREIPKPKNYDEMLKVARELSRAFPHARIDLYNVDEKILFSEITFFDGSGYMQFSPSDFDGILGDAFVLPNKTPKSAQIVTQ